jgi:hypothetical protein
MSKSVGNVVTPLGLLEQHGTDAVRYWAANGRLGTDTAFDEGQMKVGRRLAVKLLNASKFALAFPQAEDGPVTEPLDRALLARLADVVDEATAAFELYDYTRALERTEAFFWSYCDDYIELVKGRAYGEGDAAQSASRALRLSLDVLLRLFAPVLPFATEEVWSWWQEGSVHAQPWPEAASLREAGGDDRSDPDCLSVAAEVLQAVRRAKSEAKASMRTPVTRADGDGAAAVAELFAARRGGPAQRRRRRAGRARARRRPGRRGRARRGAGEGAAQLVTSAQPAAAGAGRAGDPLPGRGRDGPGPRPHPAALRPARARRSAATRRSTSPGRTARAAPPAWSTRCCRLRAAARAGTRAPHLDSVTERITSTASRSPRSASPRCGTSSPPSSSSSTRGCRSA